jgi:hypothetical protein
MTDHGERMKAQEAEPPQRKQRMHPRQSPVKQWRALWELEDGQPAWLRDSMATMDAYVQGQMGHT